MDEEKLARLTERAIDVAGKAWDKAHRGLPSNPMTRTAAIPATGIIAVALLGQLDDDDEGLTRRAEDAIAIARRAWERTHRDTPGNPIAATAARSVIGILAAGILDYSHRDQAEDESLDRLETRGHPDGA